jgi:phage terminase large subunit
MQLVLYGRRQFRAYRTRTQRYAVLVAHRRCGKTVACVQGLIDRSTTLTLPHGRYAYVGPYLSQAKETAWEYLKRFAEPIIANKNEGELWVETTKGDRIRIHGADNPDRLRGAYLDGVVLDEYADMRPSVYSAIVRPMLADRAGWATFIGTPRGRNEFHKIWTQAQGDPRWFAQMLRASETCRIDDSAPQCNKCKERHTGGVCPKEIADSRRDMTPEEYAQEWECSFDAAIQGAYYGKEIAEAERAGRVTEVLREPAAPINCSWDLGISDNGLMALWVFQVVLGQIRVLDQYSNAGFGLDHYVRWLNDRGWAQRTDWVPHDAKVRELGTGKSRIETLTSMGCRLELVPNLGRSDGINATRIEIGRMWFNQATTAEGLEALRQYRTEYDERTKTFGDSPRRDWTTDIADAARYMAVAARELSPPPVAAPKVIGVPLSDLTHDQFFELEDRPQKRERV